MDFLYKIGIMEIISECIYYANHLQTRRNPNETAMIIALKSYLYRTDKKEKKISPLRLVKKLGTRYTGGDLFS